MIYITALRIERMAWSSEIVRALANIHIAKYYSQLFEKMFIHLRYKIYIYDFFPSIKYPNPSS